MADDIVGLLDYLGISSTDVIGHSQDAPVAAQVAMRRPDQIGRVLLVAGPFVPDSLTYAREQAVLLRDLPTGYGFESMYRDQGYSDFVARVLSASRRARTDIRLVISVARA